MERQRLIANPYRPGAGHRPPFLAGREKEQEHFWRLLRQNYTTENILITGLRGFGKTVLLEDLKRMALAEGWVWVGNDLSESSSLSEERLALRILTDLSQALSEVLANASAPEPMPSGQPQKETADELDPSTFAALKAKYEQTPGLPSDKLKTVFARIGSVLSKAKLQGIVLAYDEAHCLTDHAKRDEFPLSMLIEMIESLQKREGVTPILLVLRGLPQVFDSLIQAHTYTERMFHVMHMDRLSPQDTLTAFLAPLEPLMPPLYCPRDLIEKVVELSGGYPYLIQFFGKELVDALLKNGGTLETNQFPSAGVMDRLDIGLFAARWNKTTDKQRKFLKLIASRGATSPVEFTQQEIAQLNSASAQFDSEQVNKMMSELSDCGLIYRTRQGHYAFTVPMSETMILRRLQKQEENQPSLAPEPPSFILQERPQPQKEVRKKKFSIRIPWTKK